MNVRATPIAPATPVIMTDWLSTNLLMNERVAPMDLRSPNSPLRSFTDRVVVALTRRTAPLHTKAPEMENCDRRPANRTLAECARALSVKA